jgi:hypothetical protein
MTDRPKSPRDSTQVDLSGPPNQTLFWNVHSFTRTDLRSIVAEWTATWEHYRPVTDDRLVALVALLCIEGSIDRLLTAIAPGFDKYVEDLDFTVSVKTKIAKSLQLLPTRILTACDLIRQIRNEFAHHVEFKRFEHLERKFLAKLEPHLKGFVIDPGYDPNHAPQQTFKDLVGYVLLGLSFYTLQTSRLRTYLSVDSCRTDFEKWCADTFQEPEDQDPDIWTNAQGPRLSESRDDRRRAVSSKAKRRATRSRAR